uniref:Uncharacterized protein n=1 Tax=Saccoglossus kowalevskii TaxID=10224 RepID=A0ABM0MYP1_SACKO|nr:PREDICTED: putative protein TPRXL-like [Saccoglossus kowalevskii]
MNYPGLNVPLPPAPPLSYFPVSSLSALAAGSTVVQNPVNPLVNSSSMLMNPLLHNPSSYLPGLPYPSVVDPSEVHSGGTSSKKCATNTPVESPPSSKSSAETSKPNMPAVPSESTIDSQLPGLDDSSNQGSSNSSRSSSSNLNFDDMGDLSNLINFTQSNWLSNSMQSVGDIDSSPGDKNAVNRSTDDNSPTSEEKHAAVINLPSDWDI